MINQTTKSKLAKLQKLYHKLSKGRGKVLREISLAEIPESVYNSNAIENSTLSLEDTEKILLQDSIPKELNVREVYEAKNLAKIMEMLLKKKQKLSIDLILNLHKILLTGIDDSIAGRGRSDLINKLINEYNKESDIYFLDKIANFYAEFETIRPFSNSNGIIGRIIINQQLMALNLPPIIIPNRSKNTIFALLLSESLHRRISILTSKRIIPLFIWVKRNGIKGNIAANKAKRQTIPAFRMREKWMISGDFHGK